MNPASSFNYKLNIMKKKEKLNLEQLKPGSFCTLNAIKATEMLKAKGGFTCRPGFYPDEHCC